MIVIVYHTPKPYFVAPEPGPRSTLRLQRRRDAFAAGLAVASVERVFEV